MEGNGKLMWRDGKMYEGNFVNDKREGQGTFSWADGRKYIGEWKAGKQHGVGTYISKEGVERQGEWANGRKINPDSKLAALLKLKKTDELTYFNLQRYMKPHFPPKQVPVTASA